MDVHLHPANVKLKLMKSIAAISLAMFTGFALPRPVTVRGERSLIYLPALDFTLNGQSA